MPDLKSALINIQQQIRSSIESQKNIDRQIQHLIDGIDLSPDRSVESIEALMKSRIEALGENLYHRLKDDFSQETGFIRNELDEIKKDRVLAEPVLFPVPNQGVTLSNEYVDQKQQAALNSWQKLSDDYNQLGIGFGSYYSVIEVDETKDFIEIRRAKSDVTVFLSPSTSGKFWLVEINGYSCLMPNPKQPFNKHNSELLESLFFFQEPYYAGYKRIFLISPAILYAERSAGVTAWQLQAKGSISFTL